MHSDNKHVKLFDHVLIKKDDLILLKNFPIQLDIVQNSKLDIKRWKGAFELPTDKAMVLPPCERYGKYELILSDGRAGGFYITKALISLDVNIKYWFEGMDLLD